MSDQQSSASSAPRQDPRINLVSRRQANRFLVFLDPVTDDFAFQTYSDAKDKRPGHTVLGTEADTAARLIALNRDGNAVHVTINRVKPGRPRIAFNVDRVRKHFVDFDTGGNTLAQILQTVQPLKPAMVVESSPGKFHCYFNIAEDVRHDLAGFPKRQKQLAVKFGGDPTVCDLPRVLRLPGYWHQKNPDEPHQVRIVHEDAKAPSYTIAGFDQVLAGVVINDPERPARGEEPAIDEDDDVRARVTRWFKEAPVAIADTENPDWLNKATVSLTM